jgi:hypothetical protein
MKKILDWAKGFIGEKILAIILSQLLTPENLKKSATELLEFFDDLAKKTETPIDDQVIAKIRETFGIADIPEDPPAPPAV